MGHSKIAPLVEKAWCAFDRAPSRVTPAAPILFFGDLNAYRASPLRVLTVGLNPSSREFPGDDSFLRFPLLEDHRDREPGRYLNAMSAYFRTHPYRRWFNAYEHLLNGAQTSYYAGKISAALHTDICSPIATDPTWGKLDMANQEALKVCGVPLWHELLKVLRPQLVVLSIAKMHLDRISFPAMAEWHALRAFERTGNGDLRKRPYEVRARWYEVDGGPSLVVFGQAAQTPFGLLSRNQKYQVGAVALETDQDGR